VSIITEILSLRQADGNLQLDAVNPSNDNLSQAVCRCGLRETPLCKLEF